MTSAQGQRARDGIPHHRNQATIAERYVEPLNRHLALHPVESGKAERYGIFFPSLLLLVDFMIRNIGCQPGHGLIEIDDVQRRARWSRGRRPRSSR